MFGKICLSISAFAQILGPFLADFNETHVKNPRWPAHAKFHNGQTMSMGVALALATLYYTWRTTPVIAAKDSLFTATVFSSLYWITGLSAILYPGAKGMDPEFGEGFPQIWLFGGLLITSWVGYWAEMREVASVKIA